MKIHLILFFITLAVSLTVREDKENENYFFRTVNYQQGGINGKHILFQRLWRNILQFQRLDCIGEEIPRRFEYRIRDVYKRQSMQLPEPQLS